MAVTFVQKASESSASETLHQLTFPGSVASGSFLIAFVRQTGNGADTPTDFSDNINGAWTPLINGGGGNSTTRNYCYYLKNSGAGTITVGGTSSAAKVWRWCIAEYSGVHATTPIDDTYSAAFATDTSILTGTVTTTVANGGLISCLITNSVETTIVPGGAETERLEQSGLIQLQDRSSTTTGTYQASWTIDPTSGGFKSLVAVITSGVSAPTITSVDSDNDITSTQTGVVIAGTNFEASQGTGSVKLIDGAIESTCTVTAWDATSITVTVVQGDVRFGSGRTIQVTTNGALIATKTVTLSVPSGTSYVDASTLKALSFDSRGRPTRLTPKGTLAEATTDCTSAVQFKVVRLAGSGAVTPDADGRLSWADTATQIGWYWHNGTVWSSVITWDLRGDFPDCTSPTVANLKFTQNSAISSIDFSTRFEDEDTVVGSRVHTLQGGSVTGLSLSSAGVLTGTPTAIATTSGLKIRCADEFGSYVETDAFSIQIEAAPNPPFFSGAIPNMTGFTAQTFQPFDTSTFATFDTGYTIAPTLPAGLSFNTGTGVISGTPTTAGVYTGYVVTYTGTGTPATSNSFQIEIITVIATALIPNVMGLNEAAATAALGDFGVSVTTDVSSITDYGLVISQSPTAGTVAELDEIVTITLGSGPVLIRRGGRRVSGRGLQRVAF